MNKIIYVEESLSQGLKAVLENLNNPLESPPPPFSSELWNWIRDFIQSNGTDYKETQTLIHTLTLMTELGELINKEKAPPSSEIEEKLALSRFYLDEIQKLVSLFIIQGQNDTARKFSEIRVHFNDMYRKARLVFDIKSLPDIDVRMKDLPSLHDKQKDIIFEKKKKPSPKKVPKQPAKKERPTEKRESLKTYLQIGGIILVFLVLAGFYLYQRTRTKIPPPVPAHAFSGISIIENVESHPPYIYLIVKDEWSNLSRDEKKAIIQQCFDQAQKYRYSMLLFMNKQRKPLARYIAGTPVKWYE